MEYLAVLGRQAEISLAELGAYFSDVQKISSTLATFTAPEHTDFSRLGGTIKVGIKLDAPVIDFGNIAADDYAKYLIDAINHVCN